MAFKKEQQKVDEIIVSLFTMDFSVNNK